MRTMARVNYRGTNDGELIAVFFGKQDNGKFVCYSFCDDMFFDSDEIFLRFRTRKANGYKINKLNARIEFRGITPIYTKRMVYK